MDFERDVRLADKKTASILNSYNPDCVGQPHQ